MKGKLFLVHWDQEETDEMVLALRSHGWHVSYESTDVKLAISGIELDNPDKVVISLSTQPDKGLEVAQGLVDSKAANGAQVILLDADSATTEQVEKAFPKATLTGEADLISALSG